MLKIFIVTILFFNFLHAGEITVVSKLKDLNTLSKNIATSGEEIRVKNTLNGGVFIYVPSKKQISKRGLIYKGWVRKEHIQNPKVLKLQWFLNVPAGKSGEPDKETNLDHTDALVNLFKNIEHGMTVYIPNGVFYSNKELSCAGKHYVNFVGEGYALQQNSGFASNSRLQYRGNKKNATFIDAGKHPSFRNIAIWGNGCLKEWKRNHLQSKNGSIAIKLEGSLNAINLQLKYHKVGLYFWKDSYYTRTNGLEIKYTDLAFSYKQTPYNQKHFGAIFQEVAKFWDKSGRAVSFIGCSFEHFSEQNIIYPATKVTFSNCYFETTQKLKTLFKVEKRASLSIRDSMIYTKNCRYMIDNVNGYYSVFISENNAIVNDLNTLSTYVKLSPDNKGQVIKMFGDQLEFDYPMKAHYISSVPIEHSADIVLPKGEKLYLDDGQQLNNKERFKIE